ncbi:hypothetical protein Nepgr_016166 [Nepenthes gracilis]|uniref:3'-5' exonuclease domain-containing protein n=1 Tax=Nepenthes gracilis TaxID=150966 RepID=A0AAD3XS96_NEPGR|nr:hypothetical protein Nepgr_016166 [Nepenthes gracilis]
MAGICWSAMRMEISNAVRATKKGKVGNRLGGGEAINFVMVYAKLDAVTSSRPPSQIPAVVYFVSLYRSISLYLLRACAAVHLSSSSAILRTKTLERRMIPKAILSKMGKLQGVEHVIVGVDLHASKNRWSNCSTNSLLVICINDVNCLIVQLKYVDKIPENLKKFLSDRRICFVGVGVDWKLSRGVLPSLGPLVCKMTELSHLAARIRREPSYCNSNLKALAAAYEVPYEPPALWGCCGGRRINYEARVFSKEEVKALVHDAYVCYKIGQKLEKELHRNDTTQETQELPGDETTQGTQ